MDPGTDTRSKKRPQDASDDAAEHDARFARLVPVLLALAGVAGSVLLSWSSHSREHVAAKSAFRMEAAERLAAVHRELDANLEQLYSVVALFDSSEKVEPDEFATFTANSFDRHRPLRALLWIESTTGTPPYPVRFARSEEAAPLIGVDLSRWSVIADTFERCRTSAELTVSPALPAQDSLLGGKVIAALPVFPTDGRQRGFACALLDVGRLLDEASKISSSGVALFAEDVSTGQASTLAGVPAQGPFLWPEELPVGGRTWRFGCIAPAEFLAAYTTWRPWGALLLGLLATAFLVATVAVTTGRKRIQHLVEGRALELRQAYATLAQEAKERLWAVAEAQLLERRLRQIVDLVPHMIYVKDWFGRFLLANEATARAHGTTVAELTANRAFDLDSSALSPDGPLSEERRLMLEKRSSTVEALPFLDARERRRILRQVRIPCSVFGADTRALLCVAADITDQKHGKDILRLQNELLRELAQGADPERVLSEIVVRAEEIVPDMRCSVLLLDLDGQHLRHGHAPSLPDFYSEAVDGLEIGPKVGSCGAAAFSGERVVVEDVSTHPNWAPFRELTARAGIRACWSQPIRASSSEILGTFAMYYAESRGPEPYELELMESMAHLAGIAIEKSRLEARS